MSTGNQMSRAAISALRRDDLEALGALSVLRRLHGCDRVFVSCVTPSFARLSGFNRFAGYGSIQAIADHGTHYDDIQIEFEAEGVVEEGRFRVVSLDLLDGRDLPIAV